MLFTSVANLSYFNQFNESIQNIVQEIEKDSNAENFEELHFLIVSSIQDGKKYAKKFN